MSISDRIFNRFMMKKVIKDAFSENPKNIKGQSRDCFRRVKKQFHPADIADMKKQLLKIVKESSKSVNPLRFIRKEIMTLAENFYEAEAALELKRNVLDQLGEKEEYFKFDNIIDIYNMTECSIQCLRMYSYFVYRDIAPRDWFVTYCDGVSLYQRDVVKSYLKKHGLFTGDDMMLAVRLKMWLDNFDNSRENLLSVPVGYSIPEKEDSNDREVGN